MQARVELGPKSAEMSQRVGQGIMTLRRVSLMPGDKLIQRSAYGGSHHG
ncbi:MAG: hypothetical protein RIS36_800 [Pseudomonadota bacterium]|jgi:hypothetical protein